MATSSPTRQADFEDSAYGYRPRRGAGDAIKEVHRLLCRGYTDVVDADLSKYFDTIPHAELLRCVARRIVDGEVLRLVKLWLKTPIEERDADGKRRLTGGKRSRCGTPQGGVPIEVDRTARPKEATQEVVDADLADYFGSIPHSDLLKSVARRVVDRRVLHLIRRAGLPRRRNRR